MPKQRFFTIAAGKRERVMEAAVRVAAEKGFEADVASIIKLAGIPRGSFYQYFDGMEDLIAHIVSQGRAEKERRLAEVVRGAGNMGILELYRLLLVKSLELAAENTDMTRIMSHVYTAGERGERFYADEVEATRRAFAERILAEKERGGIAPGVDAEELADILIMFSLRIIAKDLFVLKKGISDLVAKCDRFISIIRKGVE